ncbi:cation:proton antiporter, partial [Candidatus Micrarchaeota archaeon]|nr:cation:proton antiporter [Candidatus Micrarchaeota archaeon]
MESALLFDIGLAIVAATSLAFIFKLLRQPTILAYIIAGLALGPWGLSLITSQQSISVLSELGIALMLFIVGLEIDVKKLRELSGTSLAVGLGQIIVTGIAAALLAFYLGYNNIQALYLSAALVFSSTMVVVKLLSDKKELDTLHGRIILGVLLIQDIIAILFLTILPTLSNPSISPILFALAKAAVLFAATAVLSALVLPKLFSLVASSSELLFLTALSWCLSFSYFASYLGLSPTIGAFLAGVGLASGEYNIEIIGRVKSLRDFFATLFFVSLGMQISFADLNTQLLPAVLFSIFLLVISPILVYAVSRFSGFAKRTSFITSVSLAQISEFSLVIVGAGVALNHVPQAFVSLIAVIAAITIAASTYLITYYNSLYYAFSKFVAGFGDNKTREDLEKLPPKLSNHVILFGCGRMGYSIAKKLFLERKKFVAIDFNPQTIKSLIRQKIPCVYGDLSDYELLKRVNVLKA